MTTTTPEKITTAMKIDGIVDAVMTRIRDAGDSLGIVQVVERDEMPAYVESGDCYVIPLVEGKDVMRTRIGGSGGLEHQFVLTVVAYFKSNSIEAGIRSTRGAGYGVLDLFYGGHDAEMIEAFVTVPPVDEEEEEEEEEIGGDGDGDPGEPEQEPVGEYVVAHTYDPVLEVGYARITDYVLHWFIATIRIKVVI